MLAYLRDRATAVLVAFLILMITSFISANVSAWAKAKGYDNWLLNLSSKLPRFLTAGWPTTRQRWWLWLGLGMSGGLAASLWVITTYPADGPDAGPATKPPQAEFVKNQHLVLDLPNRSAPNEWWDAISYHAEYVSSGKHLIAYLEYQGVEMNVIAKPTRVQLHEFRNFLRNGDLTLSIVMREARPDGQFNFIWGADLTKEEALFLGNYRERIVLVDDLGKEQRYYFLITGGTIMNTDVSGAKLAPYPFFVSQNDLDFPAQWDAYDAQH
jgi:hypothetical protein